MSSLKDSNKIKSKFGEFLDVKSLFTFEQSIHTWEWAV